MKYLLLAALIVAVAIGTYMGCGGARIGVAKDAAIKKIDDLLGPLNVKQKEVQIAYDKLKNATAEVRDKRIEAEVRVKNHEAKKNANDADKAKLVSDLGKLQQMLKDAEADGFIERNEVKIPIEKLKDTADNTVRRLRAVKDQIVKNNTIMAAWSKNLEVLKKQDDTSDSQLKKLANQLDLIQSKKSALDAMKEAASIAGPGASISDKFNDLTDSVDELLVNIDTEFAIEEAKLDERVAEIGAESSMSLEELLDDKTDVSNTLSDIDKLLQEESGSNQ